LELFHFAGHRVVEAQRHGSIGLWTESLIVGGRKKQGQIASPADVDTG
jgi:hypothetical protein